MAANRADSEQMLPNRRRPKRRFFGCRERTFQIIHEACKLIVSITTSFGFIMYLATQDQFALLMAIAVDSFVGSVWMITLSIGAAIYGCDTLWTGVVYIPPGKQKEE